MAKRGGVGISASASWLLLAIIAVGVVIWKKKG